MGTSSIVLILILSVPLIAGFVFRVNGALLGLALSLGYVVETQALGPAISISSQISIGLSIKLILLLLPPFLFLLTNIGSVSKHKAKMNLIPLLGVSLIAALLAVPLLPATENAKINSLSFWPTITHIQPLIVSIVAIIFIVFSWLLKSKKDTKKSTKD